MQGKIRSRMPLPLWVDMDDEMREMVGSGTKEIIVDKPGGRF